MQFESTSQKIDRLFYLFEKLKEKLIGKEGYDTSNDLIVSFELILGNYNKLKQNMSDEFIDKHDETIGNLVDKLLNLLSDQVDLVENTPLNIQERLNEIDRKLKEEKLENETIDALLDERLQLLKANIPPSV